MRRGVVSFEFMIPLALVLIVTGAVLPSVMEESRETLVQTSARSIMASQLTAQEFQNEDCQNPYVSSYEVSENGNKELIFDIEPPECVTDEIIHNTAYQIEDEICGASPTSDEIIQCGEETYEIVIE